MTIELLEAAVDALDAYLEANMSDKVTELNARHGDDYEIEDPKAWYVGGYPHSMPENPSVAIVGLDWTPTFQRKANVDGDSRIDVAVFVGHNEIGTRFRMLCRYAVAIVELLQAGTGSMGYSSVNLAGSVALTEIMDTPDFLQGVIIPIRMGRSESY